MQHLTVVAPDAIPEREVIEGSDNLGSHHSIHVRQMPFTLWFVSRDGNTAVFCHKSQQSIIDYVAVLFFAGGHIAEADLLMMHATDGWLTSPPHTRHLLRHVLHCIESSGRQPPQRNP